MHEIILIIAISVILSTSPFFSKYFHIPTPAIEIILGSLAAYFGFLSDNHLFELLSEVGFFYLMFMAGMEVDLRIFFNKKSSIIKEGALYLIFLYIISFVSIYYLGLDKILIILLPMLSVGLILALYKEYDKDDIRTIDALHMRGGMTWINKYRIAK